ncbi:hypothetical protein VYA_44170 (plasmid) [Vibrio alfacsensis]|nr:hypothetical protein VYA_44170 [Vibrio alfacsensis]
MQGKHYRDEYDTDLPELLATPRKFSVLEPIGSWAKQHEKSAAISTVFEEKNI